MSDRWTPEEMRCLAASGVRKVDRMGVRGITQCSIDEIAAMAAVCARAGVTETPPQTNDGQEARVSIPVKGDAE